MFLEQHLLLVLQVASLGKVSIAFASGASNLLFGSFLKSSSDSLVPLSVVVATLGNQDQLQATGTYLTL